MTNCGLIIGKQSDYKINPQIFWKGELNKRKEIINNKEFYVEFGFRNSPKIDREEISFAQNIDKL